MATRSVRLFGIEGDRFTGAGMIERALVQHLPDLIAPGWRLDHRAGDDSIVARAFAGGGGADASIWISTPLPVRRPTRRHAHFVFDLRWRRTRGSVARAYRHVDLGRILGRSAHVFTISEFVRRDIEGFGGPEVPVSVVPLGPGQVEGHPRRAPADSRTVLVMGRAPHKRNERLAELLVESSLVRDRYSVLAVSVSDEVKRTLAPLGDRVELHDRVGTDELCGLLDRVSTYAALGRDEGFGLPYVEAAYCGADVVAVEGTVAEEVVGADGLVVPAEPTVRQLEEALSSWDEARVGRLVDRARRRSWRQAAEHVSRWLTVGEGPT